MRRVRRDKDSQSIEREGVCEREARERVWQEEERRGKEKDAEERGTHPREGSGMSSMQSWHRYFSQGRQASSIITGKLLVISSW